MLLFRARLQIHLHIGARFGGVRRADPQLLADFRLIALLLRLHAAVAAHFVGNAVEDDNARQAVRLHALVVVIVGTDGDALLRIVHDLRDDGAVQLHPFDGELVVEGIVRIGIRHDRRRKAFAAEEGVERDEVLVEALQFLLRGLCRRATFRDLRERRRLRCGGERGEKLRRCDRADAVGITCARLYLGALAAQSARDQVALLRACVASREREKRRTCQYCRTNCDKLFHDTFLH